MSPEQREELVTVFFSESGVTAKAELINAQEIKNGGTYLVDRDHNADVILKPVSGQPLPKGEWQIFDNVYVIRFFSIIFSLLNLIVIKKQIRESNH